MYSRGFFRRLAAGVVVLAVSGATVLVTAVVANAQTPGTLTLLPATGTHQTRPTVDTSGPCPQGTTNSYNIVVDGPGTFDGTITGTTSAGISFTGPFQAQFALSMESFAQVVGQPIPVGRFDIALRCVSTFGQEGARFTTAMFFTSPTAYTTTDPNAPPSPSPSPVVSPSPSPSPPPVSPSPPPPSPPPPSPSPSPPSPSPSPSPPPGGATASEVISVNVLAGALTITVANQQATLPPPTLNPAGTLLTTSGSLNPVTVTDTRAGNVGWNISGQVSAFTNGPASINGGNLGWSPSIVDKGPAQTITAGPVVPPADGIAPGATPPSGVGLASSRTLATAAAGAGIGTANLTAGLALNAPTSTTAGTYTATLTLTAI